MGFHLSKIVINFDQSILMCRACLPPSRVWTQALVKNIHILSLKGPLSWKLHKLTMQKLHYRFISAEHNSDAVLNLNFEVKICTLELQNTL